MFIQKQKIGAYKEDMTKYVLRYASEKFFSIQQLPLTAKVSLKI